MDLLSEHGFRQDGRLPDQIRQISCKMGVYRQADGSAYLEQGSTKVLAAVYGPHEMRYRHKMLDDKCFVNCQYSMATFSTTERKVRPRGDRKSQEFTQHLQKTFDSAILTQTYPRSQIDIFCEILQKWSEKGPMNTNRCYVSSAVVDGNIFVMGGYNGNVRVNSTEYYSIINNQWTKFDPMNYQRSDAHAAVIDDKIYICGGFNGQDCLQTAEMFDPRQCLWTKIRQMNEKRSGIGVTSMDGVLYAVGGFDGGNRLNTIERFDPRTDFWEKLQPMTTPRSNFGLEILEGNLYVTGGFNGMTTIAQCECYEARTNSWRKSPSMNVPRSALYTIRLEHLPNPRYFCKRKQEETTY